MIVEEKLKNNKKLKIKFTTIIIKKKTPKQGPQS